MPAPEGIEATEGLTRVGRGLIAYGIVGLIVAAIGFGAMVWVNGRISHVRGEAAATVARLAITIDVTAAVLRGAATTAHSFSTTADVAQKAVSSAAVTATQVRSELAALEAQLRSVNFLGATPLTSSADAVGRIATGMDGLDTEISLIAGSLTEDRDALAIDATLLSELAASTKTLAARFGPSVGQDSLDEVQQVIAITLLMFAAWSFVPAGGALALGLWLRRGPRTDPPPRSPPTGP